MIDQNYIRLMAAYGEWQNRCIYGSASELTDEARKQDRGAFFGSIHATLSHLLWGDQIWLHRLAGTDHWTIPAAPDVGDSLVTHPHWPDLHRDRQATDAALLNWAQKVTPADLEGEFAWESTSGGYLSKPKWTLVVQLFNHGTHHRGQVHAMLTAAGATTQDTDVQYMDSAHA